VSGVNVTLELVAYQKVVLLKLLRLFTPTRYKNQGLLRATL